MNIRIRNIALAVTVTVTAVLSESFRTPVIMATANHDDTTAKAAVADTSGHVTRVLDTLRIPDSLKYLDPFKYKYFTAIRDSVTRMHVRDSLISVSDTMELSRLDSLFHKDSSELADARFRKWYNSLSRKERKRYDAEQALPAKIAHMDSLMAYRDSVKLARDSIAESTPRILETFALADSLQYKRLVMWTHDRKFHDMKMQKQDTTSNYHFYDYPFFKEDLNVTYLGISGSAVQSYNFFKRKEEENMSFYSPYLCYTYTPETLPMYNTKTPYTELAYSGSTFAMREKEESNVRVLTTQNLFPALNLTLGYVRYGGKGILKNEDTDNRTAIVAANYVGKKYLMHAGYLYNKVGRTENGGAIDDGPGGMNWIRDTTVDAKEIAVRLSNANTLIKKNTVFLDQSYRIPFSFLHKLGKKAAPADSTAAAMPEEPEKISADSLDRNVTTAFIGHSSEYTAIRKVYTDKIGLDDIEGRKLYNDNFFLNPTMTNDSIRVTRFENKAFIRLQPWKQDGIVSKLDVGVGDKLMNYYIFDKNSYLSKGKNVSQNSAYLYAGARGQYKNYFIWDADGQYTFAGSELNDFAVNGNIRFNFYPFRAARKSPLSLDVSVATSLKEPDFYQQHYFGNHSRWENEFSKISRTTLQARLSIPHWSLDAEVGYALLNNNIYYDTLSIVRQNTEPMSVLSASLSKTFRLWKFHLENSVLAQISSNEDVLPLPTLSARFRYYLQFDVVKKVMQMQIGANAWVTANWYSPAWNPALGVFYNQKECKYGTTPYIDAFVNIQWKRACIFVKLCNANVGWPMSSADYFSAHHYIRPQRVLKFGVFWPFYVQTGQSAKRKTDSNRGGR